MAIVEDAIVLLLAKRRLRGRGVIILLNLRVHKIEPQGQGVRLRSVAGKFWTLMTELLCSQSRDAFSPGWSPRSTVSDEPEEVLSACVISSHEWTGVLEN